MCRNLRVKFHVPDYDPPSIVLESGRRCKASDACFQLHRFSQECSSKRLLALPDQGKVARALISDSFASSSSWIYSGLNLRFSDWRFIHRARLNVIPTRQNINRWADDENPLCRVCNTDPETLPHILCHCPTNMLKIRERHNLIVDRLLMLQSLMLPFHLKMMSKPFRLQRIAKSKNTSTSSTMSNNRERAAACMVLLSVR